ncbi:polyprotein [Pineapple mealybug wilt-associated virus 6]|nr:polyprotein [Pineapple mealybug wilt-associated virus 6]WCR39359.1 ORF-1a [Pineapple mealybug wilt-associated virus 6]
MDGIGVLRSLKFPTVRVGHNSLFVASTAQPGDDFKVWASRFAPTRSLPNCIRDLQAFAVCKLAVGGKRLFARFADTASTVQVQVLKGRIRVTDCAGAVHNLSARGTASKCLLTVTRNFSLVSVEEAFVLVSYAQTKAAPQFKRMLRAEYGHAARTVPREGASRPVGRVENARVMAAVPLVVSMSSDPNAAALFNAFYREGGGVMGCAFSLSRGFLRLNATGRLYSLKNTNKWTPIWDDDLRCSVYFCYTDGKIRKVCARSGPVTIMSFLRATPLHADVALPDVELYCPRRRQFVSTRQGWCWFNHKAFRAVVMKMRGLASYYTVGEMMSVGVRGAWLVKYQGATSVHITSLYERQCLGYAEKFFHFLDLPKTLVVSGDTRTRGTDILASVANALNQEEVYSSVVSNISNRLALRDQSVLLAHLDARLCDMFSQRDAMLREKPNHKCTIYLRPAEKETVKDLFPELMITFEDRVKSTHPMANAMRGCFNALFSKKCEGTRFIDIGGSFTYHVRNKHVNSHVCNPLLDTKDAKRRLSEVVHMNNFGSDSYFSSDVMVEAAAKSVSYCGSASQMCSHKAEMGFMVDVYDMDLSTLVEAIDRKGIVLFDFALMFPVELLRGDGEIYIEELDTVVRRRGDELAYSVGQSGEMYKHSFRSVSSLLTSAYACSKGGSVYKIEYEGYRGGYHCLSLNRTSRSVPVDEVVRRMHTTFYGKTIVYVPSVDGAGVSFRTLVLDTDFVDRVYSYALNTISSFETRTFEYAVGAVRSQKTHVITGTRVVHSKVDISSDDMWGLIVAIVAQAVKDRMRSLETFRIIQASEGSLTAMINVIYRRALKMITHWSVRCLKGVIRDNFEVLESLVASPENFIVRVPKSFEVKICTRGKLVDLNVSNAFAVARDRMISNLRQSRLRCFSRELVKDAINVLKNKRGDDGKPVPLTEDSVFEFITGNLGNIHCTRAGLLGGRRTGAGNVFARTAVWGPQKGTGSTGTIMWLLNKVDRYIANFDHLSFRDAAEKMLTCTDVFSEIGHERVEPVKIPTPWERLNALYEKTRPLMGNVVERASVLFSEGMEKTWQNKDKVGLALLVGGAGTLAVYHRQRIVKVCGLVRPTVENKVARATSMARSIFLEGKVPSALVTAGMSYYFGGIKCMDLLAHLLPKNLMLVAGVAGVLRACNSLSSKSIFGGALFGVVLPTVVWKGVSFTVFFRQILVSSSLIWHSLCEDQRAQLQIVPSIEGRNVYDQALRFFRDIDVESGLVDNTLSGDDTATDDIISLTLDDTSEMQRGVSEAMCQREPLVPKSDASVVTGAVGLDNEPTRRSAERASAEGKPQGTGKVELSKGVEPGSTSDNDQSESSGQRDVKGKKQVTTLLIDEKRFQSCETEGFISTKPRVASVYEPGESSRQFPGMELQQKDVKETRTPLLVDGFEVAPAPPGADTGVVSLPSDKRGGNSVAEGVKGEDAVGAVNEEGTSKKFFRRGHSDGSCNGGAAPTTLKLWLAQDFVQKSPWLQREEPILALKKGYTPMAFEVVSTRTSEDACLEYMKYCAISIQKVFMAMMVAKRLGVVLAHNAVKFPNQVYEQLPGLQVYTSADEVVFHPDEDNVRVRDLPYVFLWDKEIFVRGRDLLAIMDKGEKLLVADETLVFHSAINFKGCMRVARSGLVGKAFRSVDYKCVNAPPGGGKTTMMIDEFLKDPHHTAMMTANVGSAEDINFRLRDKRVELKMDKFASTVNSRVVNYSSRDSLTVALVDEVYMIHEGLLAFAVYATGARKCVFYGDMHQIPFINREKVFRTNYTHLRPDEDRVEYTKQTYRCPLDVCYILSSLKDPQGKKCYVGSVISGKAQPVVRSLKKRPVGTPSEVLGIPADVYLCQTQAEKAELIKEAQQRGLDLQIKTVHEAQGKTFGSVVLFRLKKADDSVFSSQPHVLVALSRHTTSFTYAAISTKLNDKLGSLIDTVADRTVGDELLHTFAPAGCFRDV